VDHGPQLHAVVLSKADRCQHLVGGRRIRQVARDECERRSAFGRRDENAEVVRVDRVAAVARRLTTGRADELRGGGDPRKLGDLRHGLAGVHKGVEAVGGDKPWERGLRSAARGRGGQHEPPNDTDEDRNGQPGPPSTAQLSAKRQANGPQDASSPQPLTSVLWMEGGSPRWSARACPSCQHPTVPQETSRKSARPEDDEDPDHDEHDTQGAPEPGVPSTGR
jgi:hypothetical protein